MATIDSRDIIDEMIRDNGETYVPEGEEPVMRIVEYTNFNGGTCWGVVWFNEPVSAGRYLEATDYVRNPHVIWERKDLLEKHPYR